jgi:hypothetical protein
MNHTHFDHMIMLILPQSFTIACSYDQQFGKCESTPQSATGCVFVLPVRDYISSHKTISRLEDSHTRIIPVAGTNKYPLRPSSASAPAKAYEPSSRGNHMARLAVAKHTGSRLCLTFTHVRTALFAVLRRTTPDAI